MGLFITILKYLFKKKSGTSVCIFFVKSHHKTSEIWLYCCRCYVHWRAEGWDVLTLRKQCQSCKSLADMGKDREGEKNPPNLVVFWNLGLPQLYEKPKLSEMAKYQSIPPLELMSLADDSDADVKECPYNAPLGLICRWNYGNSVLWLLLGRPD